MNKQEEQCYLAGYNGKKRPPWVSNRMEGLVKAYKAGQADRRHGRSLQFREGVPPNIIEKLKKRYGV